MKEAENSLAKIDSLGIAAGDYKVLLKEE